MVYTKFVAWVIIEWVSQATSKAEIQAGEAERFPKIVSVVLENEGGWADHPPDAGGVTRYGISSRSHPHINLASLTPQKAAAIYRALYWDTYYYDTLKCEQLAYKVFDMSVLLGPDGANDIFVEAMQVVGMCISVRTKNRREIMAAANNLDPVQLMKVFKRLLRDKFKRLATKDPAKAIYLRGWLKRVNLQPPL